MRFVKAGLICAVLIFFAGCSATHVTAPAPVSDKHPKLVDHTINLTWQQSTVNNGFCSSTVTTSCISGFNGRSRRSIVQVQNTSSAAKGVMRSIS